MSRFKFIAFIGLITLAFGVALVADALAGEKVKGRCNFYRVKYEQIEVGDQEGHVIAVFESKGIGTNREGGSFYDGWVESDAGLLDLNLKTRVGTAKGHEVVTDPDGDKLFVEWEGTVDPGGAHGKHDIVNGTGKWEGIRAKGTFTSRRVGPNQNYADWEMDVEFPGR